MIDDERASLEEITQELHRIRAERITEQPVRRISMRPTVTRKFLELNDPERYEGPSVQMGVGWYDRPNGTSDHEGVNPCPTTISSGSNATGAA